MDFAQFVEDAIGRAGLNVNEFERITGSRFRHIKQGRQKPPLASLHRWAEVLKLDQSDKLRLLILANEAHGGDTIAAWIVDEIKAARRDRETLKSLYDEQVMLIAELRKKLGER